MSYIADAREGGGGRSRRIYIEIFDIDCDIYGSAHESLVAAERERET